MITDYAAKNYIDLQSTKNQERNKPRTGHYQ